MLVLCCVGKGRAWRVERASSTDQAPESSEVPEAARSPSGSEHSTSKRVWISAAINHACCFPQPTAVVHKKTKLPALAAEGNSEKSPHCRGLSQLLVKAIPKNDWPPVPVHRTCPATLQRTSADRRWECHPSRHGRTAPRSHIRSIPSIPAGPSAGEEHERHLYAAADRRNPRPGGNGGSGGAGRKPSRRP